MSLHDLYFSLEESFHKSLDAIDTHIPVRWFTDAIDKIMPSFVLVNLIIIAIIVLLIVFFAVPNTQTVTFTFKDGSIQMVESFSFTGSVDGEFFEGKVDKGKAVLEIPEGETIIVETISLADYVLPKEPLNFSENIVVTLSKMYSQVPITLSLQSYDGAPLQKTANLLLSCVSAELPEDAKNKTISSGSFTVNVPENCGGLIIAGQVDGYILQSGDFCDSSTCVLEFAPITQPSSNGFSSLPTGMLKVNVLDSLGNLLSDAKVKIFDAQDLKNEIDISTTNPLGNTKLFTALVVGTYTIYVSKDGYLDNSITDTVEDNKTTDVKITLSQQSLGNLKLLFVDEKNKKLAGDLVLKDKTGKIVFMGFSSEDGIANVPILAYDKYYLDFAPDNNALFPLGDIELAMTSTLTEKTITVKEKSVFNSSQVNITVLDEDSQPVEGAKIFVQDSITHFELISFDNFPDTDKNGQTKTILPQGNYQLRAYNGFSEALSDPFVVTTSESGEIPKIDVTINMTFGYALLKLNVKDEFGTPVPNAMIKFYKKPNVESNPKITDVSGSTFQSFKAGVPLYFTVEKENYITYYSEARLLMTNSIWDENVVLKQIKQDSPKVKFLGMFESIGGKEEKAMNIGQIYYLGFEISLYEAFDSEMRFEISVGEHNTIEEEKLALFDAYTSASKDIKYLDKKKENMSLGDAKIIVSEWLDGKSGIYKVFYKIKVNNDSSVKVYDPLRVSWKLKEDETVLTSETKDFLAGTKGVCAEDEFCGRYTLLDKTSDLYLDTVNEDQFMVTSGNKYELVFDLINGLDGSEGEIKNGELQIYNATTPDTSLESVKNSIAENSFLHLLNYKLNGPTQEFKDEKAGDLFGVFVPQYSFTDLIKNRYISGTINFIPVLNGNSYMNFVVVDKDKHVVVDGKSALSLLFNTGSQKKLNVSIFPDEFLAPGTKQDLTVFVTDDANSYVKDASVSVRIKTPSDLKYSILDYCKDLQTDAQGKAVCHLQPLLSGTYVQVLVEKDGYESYSQKNFAPDVQVTTKLFDLDPEKLDVTLTYPLQDSEFLDLTIINNSASKIILDSSEIIVDNYSVPNVGLLNLVSMETYLSQFNNREILGKQLNFDETGILAGEAKELLKNFFKAELNSDAAKLLDKDTTVSGVVKMHFKTEEETFTRTVPFSVKIVSQGTPTNSGDCLTVSLDTEQTSFASDGTAMSIYITFQNKCIIDDVDSLGNLKPVPVVFDSVYAVLSHDSGALGLGSFSFMLNSGEQTSLSLSVPKVFATNFQTNLDDPTVYGNIGFIPKGVMGKENLKFWVFGLVKTSDGYKKVESKELSFDVSVLKLEECIKVLDDVGEELPDVYTLEPREFSVDTTSINPLADKFKLKFKNECTGLKLNVQLCKGNTNETSKACGENVESEAFNGYTGFKFESLDSTFTDFELEDEKDIEIFRPEVSGAYALEVFAKQEGDASYKKVKFVPINVQTSLNNSFFMPNAFLQTTEISDNNFTTDVMTVYYSNVPEPFSFTDKNNFLSVLDSNFDYFKIGDRLDLEDEWISWNAVEGIAGSGLFLGSGAMTGLLIAGVLTPGVGMIGLTAGLFVVGVNYIISSFESSISDKQENKYLILSQQDTSVVNVSDKTISVGGNNVNYADIFKLSGQDKYQFIIVKESIEGEVGCEGWFCSDGEYWSDSLKFNATCPVDYEVDKDRILYLDSGDKHTTFNDCFWNKQPEIASDNRTVTFYPKCGSDSSFEDVEMNTYVVVPCKLNSKQWSYSTQEGISGGPSNAGLFKAKFLNLDFQNLYTQNPKSCDTEWCFKNYPLNVQGGVLGELQSNLRLAFHNPKPPQETFAVEGQACTDVLGNVIGFTGEDAKPKVSYNWNSSIPESFCSFEDGSGKPLNYCDATQMTVSTLKHIANATKQISNLSDLEKCPQSAPYVNVEGNATQQGNYFTKVEIRQQDNKEMFLQLTKTLQNNSTVNYAVYLQEGNQLPFETESKVESKQIDEDGTTKVILSANYKLLDVPKIENMEEGYNSLLDKKYSVIVKEKDLFGNPKNTVATVTIDVNLYANVDKGGCIVETPSTQVLPNGKMLLFMFLPDVNQNKLFEIQELLHFKAYLMDDGYSKQFLQDLVDSANGEFLSDLSPILEKLQIEEKLNSDRFVVVNEYTGDSKTDGPGLYEVHINIVYPKNKLDFDDKNTVVQIVLRKISGVVNDNIFYYMPVDGMIGIDNATINRTGYGIDFTEGSDQITFTKFGTSGQLFSNLGSNSNPKAHISVSKDLDFETMNSSASRGTVLDLKLEEGPINNVEMKFVPNLKYWKFTYNMKNEFVDSDVGLFYKVVYGAEDKLSDNSLLPWFVEDYTKIDMTGQSLIDTYPKMASQANPGEVSNYSKVSKISYDAGTVTDKAEYNIYTILYGKDEDSLNLEVVKTENLENNDFDLEEGNLNGDKMIDSIQSVLEGIDANKLCISKSGKLHTRVFVNENELLNKSN